MNVGEWATSTAAARGPRSHVCHCIGCCAKCGQCRTAPWHPETCDRIAALRAEERSVIEEARS